MFEWLKKRATLSNGKSPAPDAANPPDRETLRRQGRAGVDASDFETAENRYRQLVNSDAADVPALCGLGFVLMQLGRQQEAIDCLTKAVTLAPTELDAHYMLGGLYESAGAIDCAIHHLQHAVALAPEFPLASRDLARVLFRAGRSADAEALLERALARNDRLADHHFYLANLQLESGDLEASQAGYMRAVAIELRHAPAWFELGRVQQRKGDLDAATASYRRVLEIDPGYPGAAAALGSALQEDGQPALAVRAFERAVAAAPADAGLRNNLGNALVYQHRPAEALVHYEQALLLQPDFADALVNMGQALSMLERADEATTAYSRAHAIDPGADFLCGNLLYRRLGICDWRGLAGAFDELARRIDNGEPAAAPFTMLAAPLTPQQQLRCAQTYVARCRFPPAPPWAAAPTHRRLRLGYFSADFHGHATAYLMAELFERHDRERFELIALSFGPPSSHPMRKRLEDAFDQFIDVCGLSDSEITARSRALEVDVAIDLKGFTQDCRPGIFARRAAPIQVSYIGYPGTLGSPFIDYLIADATVVPSSDLPAYAEKIVFMPNAYQVNDSKREIGAAAFTRADCGLPVNGFVFCCFNNNYKISPDVFDVWMSLLKAVPGSALWLLADTPQVVGNLRAEACARGVEAERLVFAERVPMPQHLARQALADLFLDTLYYNAHTTASDALWAGLPVLTCLGSTFAARVAGSLLRAAGLPELVVASLPEYAALALALANDPVRLIGLRARLAAGRATCPLFDAALFARHLEAAYGAMWKRHQAGLAPDHLHIAA